MKKIFLVCMFIITFPSFSKIANAFETPNIINEFVITGDSSKFYFPIVANFNNDKIYLFFSYDNKYKMLCYNLNGELLGQNKYEGGIYYVNQIDFYEDKISIKRLTGKNDTIRYSNFIYDNELRSIDVVKENTYFNGYIDSYISNIPRKDSCLYFILFSLNKENSAKQEYRILVTDLNYHIIRFIELDNSNIDADIYSGGSPIYYLDNGHFTFRILKSKNGNPLIQDTYTYEYDFDGKFYSKKLVDNKIVFNNDTLNYKAGTLTIMKDYSQIILCKLSDSSKELTCLIKFAPNGEIKWIKPIEDYNNDFVAPNMYYLENSGVIACCGRYFPGGNDKNPFGSYLELFDEEGNHLETYTWQRNKYLDCTVFNVVEGPDNHLLVIAKNGSDSLVVSEIIPKYLSTKENNVLTNNILLSPNPTTDKLLLKEIPDGATSYEIYNQLGIKISGGEIVNEINVSTLSTGIYFLKIGNEKPMKFVKK